MQVIGIGKGFDWFSLRREAMSNFCTFFTLLFFSILLAAASATDTNGPTKRRDEVIVARRGAVATDDGRCSRVGADILRDGGNAIDSAVGAAFCLGVVGPMSSGIGGGAFLIVRLANGTSQAFDMRETAPAAATQDMFNGNYTLKSRGPLSVGVPGEIAGLHEVWKQHGKLPWARLVRPAELLAREGFKISPILHHYMEVTKQEILDDEKGLRLVFATRDNELLKEGDIVRNPRLADTLRKIAKDGPEVFYNGSVGCQLVRDVQKVGGILTLEDLRTYQVRVRKPLSEKVLGYEVLGMPPPSSGAASMMLVFNILSRYGINWGLTGTLGVHRLVEAFKHAYAIRMNLGDPDFVDNTKALSDMLSLEFAEKLRKSINDSTTFDSSYYGGRWSQLNDHGTSHASIVDEDRNAVSMTNTVNTYFGAKFMSPSTGIILNNEMDDFSMPETNASPGTEPPPPTNFVQPGKRPLSSMNPIIVVEGDQVKAVLGGSGGMKIIGSTTQVFINYFFWGMDTLSAVMNPRIYHQLIPNEVYYENWTALTGDHFEVPLETRAALEKKGHVLESLSGGSMCQFVTHVGALTGRRGNSKLVAVSDPRKGGVPAGF